MPDNADISLPADVLPPTGADDPGVVAAPFIGVAAAEDLLEAAACF